MTDEEKLQLQIAKDELDSAIKKYCAVFEPDEYVLNWVLITHRQSLEMMQKNRNAVGLSVPTGQSFIMTRGMLENALDMERKSTSG